MDENISQSPARPGFVLGAIALMLVLLNLACWGLYPLITPKRGRMAVSALRGDDSVLRMVPNPYLYYQNNPRWRDPQGRLQHNEVGARGGPVREKRSADAVRIVTLGGSTTYGFGVDTPEKAWPAQLEALLAEQSGREVEVINGGLYNATSAELVLHYLMRYRYLKPDMVIIHAGFNDSGILVHDGYRADYSHARGGWNSAATPRPLEKWVLALPAMRVAYAWWFRNPLTLPGMGDRDAMNHPAEYFTANATANEPEGYERNLRLLLRNVRADGAQAVLMPFEMMPREHWKGHEKTFGSFVPAMEGMAIAVQKGSDLMERLGKELSVPVVRYDPSAIAPEDYLDFGHVAEKGQTYKARVLARALQGLPPFDGALVAQEPGSAPESP